MEKNLSTDAGSPGAGSDRAYVERAESLAGYAGALANMLRTVLDNPSPEVADVALSLLAGWDRGEPYGPAVTR